MQEGRNVYQLINNRNFDNYNYVTKRKISKSIRLNESPFYQEYNQNNPPDSKILIKDIKNIIYLMEKEFILIITVTHMKDSFYMGQKKEKEFINV